jgi:hypothetical protein
VSQLLLVRLRREPGFRFQLSGIRGVKHPPALPLRAMAEARPFLLEKLCLLVAMLSPSKVEAQIILALRGQWLIRRRLKMPTTRSALRKAR